MPSNETKPRRNGSLLEYGRHEQWLEASRRFLRDCVRTTQMRYHVSLLESDGPAGDDVLEGCLIRALESLDSDLARFGVPSETPTDLFERLRFAPNLLATFFYRLNHALYCEQVDSLPDMLAVVSRALTGAEIYYSAEIGPGLKLIHGVGTVIGARCRIGRSFTIYQGVTIGDKLGIDTGQRPLIGDEVIVSAGAKILGAVSIGSRTIVGANAVVTRSMPGHCIAGVLPTQTKVGRISDAQFEHYRRAIRG